jgi:hypothetical protein
METVQRWPAIGSPDGRNRVHLHHHRHSTGRTEGQRGPQGILLEQLSYGRREWAEWFFRLRPRPFGLALGTVGTMNRSLLETGCPRFPGSWQSLLAES